MRIKRMVKRLAAVGAGAVMLGATAMGALAADLSDYPNMFVTDGTFNGLAVVGEAAAAVDNIAMTDVMSAMKYSGAGATTSTSLAGDAWLVKSGSDVLEFSESIGPSSNGVVDFLDDDDLAALANGELSNSQGTFEYEQFLHFDNAVVNTTYAEDDDDVTALFLKIPDNTLFARYELNFLEAAESDIDASDSFELDDYEGREITMFGKTFSIVKAVTGGATSGADGNAKVTLTMMSGAVRDSMLTGESQSYSLDGTEWEVALQFTNSNSQASFTINGETTGLLDEGETYTLSDGTVFGLDDVLHNDYSGGVQSASYFLGADKWVLQDNNIEIGSSSTELSVNDETVDGADVIITGTVLDNATSSTEDGELEIDTIEINMTSQDDYFIAAGETLLGQPELEEKGLIFTQNWDMSFLGMDDSVKSHMISVKDKSGEKEYELTFTNLNGDQIKVPIAYASAASTVRPGDQNDKLLLNHSQIDDESYFVLNDDATDEDSVTNVVQYKGASKNTASNPKMKFKILATGETVERPITFGATASATVKLAGTTFTIQNATASSTDTDDYNITVTAGDTGTHTLVDDAVGQRLSTYFIAEGGAKIFLEYNWNYTGGMFFNVSLIDGDLHDDVLAAGDPTEAAPYQVFVANITAGSSEVDFGNVGGITLTSPDDDDDNSYGYSANGAWVTHTSPSGGGTSSNSVTLDWPIEERVPKVYITSGAVSTTTSSVGGATTPVTVVDAARLDSEVASLTAQNVILFGGPCVNTLAAQAEGNPADCTEGFRPGVARVKLWNHANGNVAMLVAGYSGADTRLAGRVVAQMPEKLSGEEVEISGSSLSSVTVSAPAPAVVAPAEDAE